MANAHCIKGIRLELYRVIFEVMTMLARVTSEQATELQVGEATVGSPKTPVPTATGNDRLTILRHGIRAIDIEDRGERFPVGIEMAISNVSDETIATALFEAVFYDIEGGVVDTVRQREVDIKPDMSRAILVSTSIPERDLTERGRIKSYAVKLIRTTTADVEKLQLHRSHAKTTEAGEEEIKGIVQNLSSVKANAALLAIFYDGNEENIGTKAIILKDIEPDSLRQFSLVFKPQDGDQVRRYTLNIGEITT